MKVPLILLFLCCFCSANQVWPSRELPCHIQVQLSQLGHSTAYYHIAPYTQPGKYLCCDTAALACCNFLTSHINGYLGTGVAPLRDTAAATLCNILKREVNYIDRVQVYAHWYMYPMVVYGDCYQGGVQYLGQLCCWEYIIGGVTYYAPNPLCNCTKPNCTESTARSLKETYHPDLFVQLNQSSDPEFSKVRFQMSQDKRYAFLSEKVRGLDLTEEDELPGFNTLDLAAEEEKEGGIYPVLEINRENVFEADHAEPMEEFEE